ncbi:MAG: YfjI family protein [Desulfitobacteriaceae bacterium]|nr:YfjI family protein [Desulfitobacteriaceae bacterium]
MELMDFLTTLFGGVSHGWISVWNKETRQTAFYEVNDLDPLKSYLGKIDWYFGVNVLAHKPTSGRGTAGGIKALVALAVDMDTCDGIHSHAGDYPDRATAFKALHAILEPSIIVDTGGGYHAYWLLQGDLGERYIDAQLHQNLPHAWQDGLRQQLAPKKLDNTADLARVLRLPGTMNGKYATPKKVRIIKGDPNIVYSVDEVREGLRSIESSRGANKPMLPEQTRPSKYPPSQAQPIIDRCGFIRHCRDDAANLPEPEWYAMISIIIRTSDGLTNVLEMSRPYPRFSAKETIKKSKHALKDAGPATCQYIRVNFGTWCDGCPERIKSPIHLGTTDYQWTPDTIEDWPDPEPLIPEINLPKFPTEVLPAILREFSQEESEFTQTPSELTGLLSIAACGLTVSKRFIVEAAPGWVEPLNLYVMVIMESGTRKTAVAQAVMEPLVAWEMNQTRSLAPEIANARNLRDINDGLLTRLKSELMKTSDERRRVDLQNKLNETSRSMNEQDIPTMPRLLADDVTPEKLVVLLAEQKGRLGILSTEGNIVEIMAGRYADGRQNLEVFLKAHSREDIRDDRISRKSNFVHHAALTMALAVQPDVINTMAATTTARERGLMGRFLYAVPPRMLGKRKIHTEPVSPATRQAYHELIEHLLNDPGLRDGSGEYIAETISFSTEAQTTFDAFRLWLENELNPWGGLGNLPDWGSKLAGAVARLSGIFWLIETEGHPARKPIPNEIAERTIRLAQEFLVPHAQHIYRIFDTESATKGALRLLDWIRDKGISEFSARDSFNQLRKGKHLDTMAKMTAALNRLLETGHIRAIEDRGGYPRHAGRPESQRFVVHPKDRRETV